MNLQSRLQNEPNGPLETATDPTQSLAAGTTDPALEQARQALARSSTPPTLAPSPTVLDVLHGEQNAERAQATMATLEMLSALDRGVAQKQKAAQQQQKTAELQQSVEEMIRRLAIETAQARRRKIMRRVKIFAYVTFVVLLICTAHWRWDNWWFFYWLGGSAWAADKTLGKRRTTVSALKQAGDPRAVGILAIAAHDSEKAVREAAQQALRELLPRVRADHAADITSPQMNALLELGFRAEPAMQIAVLQALEQIGDRRAIPLVQNLSLASDPRVREQAKHCLPFLQERVRRAEQSATLLRGTANPSQAHASGELLRPVEQSADNTPPDELLRPNLQSSAHDETTEA